VVYVDGLSSWWKGRLWCHMFADSLKELHEFAAKLNLRRDWFQPDLRLPHYDITETRRKKAVSLGAIEVDRHFVYRRIVANRNRARRKQ
jgi:hypothetical protein